jgi:phosphohistidine phosphatase
MRHGDAEDPSRRDTDEERQLTQQGRVEVAQVARSAKHAKAVPELIISSPYIRALQTAEIAGEALGYSEHIGRTNVLEPHSDPQSVWEEIRVHKNVSHLLAVGHEPLLSRTVAYLLGTPSLLIKMTTGAMVCVEIDDFGKQPRAVLRWMLTPKVTSGNQK